MTKWVTCSSITSASRSNQNTDLDRVSNVFFNYIFLEIPFIWRWPNSLEWLWRQERAMHHSSCASQGITVSIRLSQLMTWENKPWSLNISDLLFLALANATLILLTQRARFVISDVEIKAKWLEGKMARTASRLVWPSVKLCLTCLFPPFWPKSF